jgi:hypothetical protein
MPLFFLLSCEQPKEPHNDKVIFIDEFPSKVLLAGELILKEDSAKNGGIYVIDSLLLISIYKDTVFYNIYGKGSQKKIGTLGVKGNGPNEWQVSFYNSQYIDTKQGILLWFMEEERGEMRLVNLSKVIEAKHPLPILEKLISINSKKFPFNFLFYINEEKIIGDGGYFDEDRVRIKSYNPQSQEIKKSKLFPRIKNIKELPSPVLYNFYHTQFRKHPTKNLFVQAMSVMNRIDIFDEDLNLLRSMVSGKNWQDDFFDAKKIDVETDFMKDIRDGYASATVSEDFIFALVANKKKSAVTGEVQKSFIKVFDWEGQPKCLLEVNEDLFSISIDDREGYLYATAPTQEKILRYDLKKLLALWK